MGKAELQGGSRAAECWCGAGCVGEGSKGERGVGKNAFVEAVDELTTKCIVLSQLYTKITR